MFQLWAKLFKDNHMLMDTVIRDESEDTRTHKIFHALTAVCLEFNLAEPQWLDGNIKDFKRYRKTRFTQDNFIEEVAFDFLEIQVIEEG